jgi:hypothetical protein
MVLHKRLSDDTDATTGQFNQNNSLWASKTRNFRGAESVSCNQISSGVFGQPVATVSRRTTYVPAPAFWPGITSGLLVVQTESAS